MDAREDNRVNIDTQQQQLPIVDLEAIRIDIQGYTSAVQSLGCNLKE